MAKYSTKGVLVKTGSTVTPTTNLPQVKTVRVKPGRREMLKATAHDSSNTDEYIPRPLRDTADLELVVLWDPALPTHDELLDAHAAGTKWYFTVVFPEAGAAQFALAGFITDLEPGDLDPETGVMEMTVRFKADAAETFTQ